VYCKHKYTKLNIKEC